MSISVTHFACFSSTDAQDVCPEFDAAGEGSLNASQWLDAGYIEMLIRMGDGYQCLQ